MKKTTILILFFTYFLFFSLISYSQENIERYFDEIIKRENLTISNGKLFSNDFKTTETDQFYNTKYSLETLVYNNEIYNYVNLKYDIYRDVLIFRPYGESEKFGIELILENVNSFTIKNKLFVNLSNHTKDSLDFVKGYFEENFKNEKISFYIKHKKETKEFINNQKIFNNFQNSNKYVLFYDTKFYEIRNTKDIRRIFPYFEKELSQFEEENSLLLKNDKDAFFEKMIKKTSTLLK